MGHHNGSQSNFVEHEFERCYAHRLTIQFNIHIDRTCADRANRGAGIETGVGHGRHMAFRFYACCSQGNLYRISAIGNANHVGYTAIGGEFGLKGFRLGPKHITAVLRDPAQRFVQFCTKRPGLAPEIVQRDPPFHCGNFRSFRDQDKLRGSVVGEAYTWRIRSNCLISIIGLCLNGPGIKFGECTVAQRLR